MLIVDDDAGNRQILARHLARLGFATRSAENGREALEALAEAPVDVVLLDIVMPEMDGYEVLQRRRETPALRDIPFIVVSALDDIDSIARAVEIGAEDYLPKPFDPILLSARMQSSLEKKRHRDQELAYLQAVGRVSAAASAVETKTYEPAQLEEVALRPDEVGQLARVFQRMAGEVYAREERHVALAQLVAGVAHEINTPLGVINTANSIVRRQLSSDEIVEILKRHGAEETLQDLEETLTLIGSNIDRLHRLIQSFKNMSVSQIVDDLEALDLGELVSECLDLFRISARESNITIQVIDDLPQDQRTWLGYRGHMSQVLLNLLTNIDRYAYPDGGGGRVEVHLNAGTEGELQVFAMSVRDFGRGIGAEELKRVFDPFFTTGRSKGGTGLGLAIVRNIVSSVLQGRVTIDSSPGAGATVTIVVPQSIRG